MEGANVIFLPKNTAMSNPSKCQNRREVEPLATSREDDDFIASNSNLNRCRLAILAAGDNISDEQQEAAHPVEKRAKRRRLTRLDDLRIPVVEPIDDTIVLAEEGSDEGTVDKNSLDGTVEPLRPNSTRQAASSADLEHEGNASDGLGRTSSDSAADVALSVHAYPLVSYLFTVRV